MTPLDLIGWALAIGIAWSILTSCVPLESWISSVIEGIKTGAEARTPPTGTRRIRRPD